MQQANVYRNKELIGLISKNSIINEYKFTYNKTYLEKENALNISVNLPLQTQPFTSNILFPFFFNLLSEGTGKIIQCRQLKIDEDDHFSRLLKTTEENTIGSITLKEIRL